MCNYEIIEERDAIPVTTMLPEYEPDPEWRHIDSAGHEHVWVGNEIPTTYQALVGWAVCCEVCNEATPIHETQCHLCDEAIEPGMKLVYAAGNRHYKMGNFECKLIVRDSEGTKTYSITRSEADWLRKHDEAEVRHFISNREPLSVEGLTIN